MSRNRRRHNNEVPMRALSPWLVIAVIALVGCMTWVYFKNQLHTRGREVKELEIALRELKTQNDALRPRIDTLSSRIALQKRLSEGFIRMVPITQDHIVQVTFAQPPVAAEGEIRTVANEGARQ